MSDAIASHQFGFAAFQATYSNWRVIRGRGVIQIVLEVPTENADLAYQVLGGMPSQGEEIWLAVARLAAPSS